MNLVFDLGIFTHTHTHRTGKKIGWMITIIHGLNWLPVSQLSFQATVQLMFTYFNFFNVQYGSYRKINGRQWSRKINIIKLWCCVWKKHNGPVSSAGREDSSFPFLCIIGKKMWLLVGHPCKPRLWERFMLRGKDSN